MTIITIRETKLSAQLYMAPINFRQNSGWNFTSNSKRGRREIMAEILCHWNQQIAKTNIMYKANLNYAQLKKHLKSLTS